MLEKDGGDQLDRSCEKRSVTKSGSGEKHLTKMKKTEAKWIGHMLRRNCLLKHANEGKIEGRIEVAGK